jgi:hypothetical protein
VKKHLLLLGCVLAAPALRAQNSIGEVFSTDASVRGSVALSKGGARVLSGSQVSAGDGVALLKLERGGEVRICPKTNLSLSADQSGNALVLGLNAGAMELNYSLNSAADSLITPDFRLQLISPGTFHLAISVAGSGDTCMRTLPGNDASVFIAEMMGGGAYQLSPGRSVMFRAGKISGATDAPASCGCPEVKAELPEAAPTNQADILSPAQLSKQLASDLAAQLATQFESQAAAQSAAQAAKQSASPSPTEAAAPGEPHLKIESSFVYRGSEAAEDYYATVARLSLSMDDSGLAKALLPQVSPPEPIIKPPDKKEGRLQRMGGFLRRMFGG